MYFDKIDKKLIKGGFFPYFDNKSLAAFSKTSKSNNTLVKDSVVYKQRKNDHDVIQFIKQPANVYNALLHPFFESKALLKEKVALIHIYLFSTTEKKYLLNKIYSDEQFGNSKDSYHVLLTKLRNQLINETNFSKQSKISLLFQTTDNIYETMKDINKMAKLLIPVDKQVNDKLFEPTLTTIKGNVGPLERQVTTGGGLSSLGGLLWYLADPSSQNLYFIGVGLFALACSGVTTAWSLNSFDHDTQKTDDMNNELCEFIQKNFADALLDLAGENGNEIKDDKSIMTFHK